MRPECLRQAYSITQGGSVARHFGTKLGFHVRGVTRTPGSAAAASLRHDVPGIELVAADMDDEASLFAAFGQAEVIFSVTDFWQFMGSAAVHDAAAAKGITANEESFLREIEQSKNIFRAAARRVAEQEAAGRVRLERFVVSTLADSRAISGGAITWNYHFEGKGKAMAWLREQGRRGEGGFRGLVERSSYVHVGFYLDNWLSVPPGMARPILAPQRQDDGAYAIPSASRPPHHPWPLVLAQHDVGVLVEALVLRAPAGTELMGGQKMTVQAYGELWGRVLGVSCRFEPQSVEAGVATFPAEMRAVGREVMESAAFIGAYGWDGGVGAQWPEEVGVKTEELVDIASWIGQQDWRAVLEG